MVKLKLKHVREMFAYSEEEYPEEACGILAGRRGTVLKVYRARNSAKDKSFEYLLDPEEQMKIFRKLEKGKMEMVGIYHSHPFHEAYPSRVDVKRAFYPDCAYFIVSLKGRPAVGAFRIRRGKIKKESIIVER